MGLLIGDEARHEWMDEMLGGEGSEQLDSTHRWMGYQYLQNNGILGTLGTGLVGPGMMGGWHSPAGTRNQFVTWIWISGFLLISVAIVLSIILTRRRSRVENAPENALDILRIRYAKGEISQEEFYRIIDALK